MIISFEVDDAEVAIEVAESLRHEAESTGIVHPGTADMLRNVADQIELATEQFELEAEQQPPKLNDVFPLIVEVHDYHDFETTLSMYRQTFDTQEIRYRELNNSKKLDPDAAYLAVYFVGHAPKVTTGNYASFRKLTPTH